MKKVLLIILLFTVGRINAQTFMRTYGANDETNAKAIPAIDGGYIIAASTMFGGAPNGSLSDILIIKTDSNGTMQWSQRLQSLLDDEAYWIIADTDSTYLLCGNSYDNNNGKLDVFVIKMDLTGNVLSQKLYHSYEAERMASQQKTKDGGSFIAGETLFNGSDLQIYLLKLDSAGNIEWSRAYGDADQEYGTYGIQTHDGGYIATGIARITSFASSICVFRTDSAGDQVWAKKFNTNPNYSKCLAFRIIETADHGFVVLGSAFDTLSTISYYAMKLDSNGTLLWQNTYSTSNNDYVYDAIADSSGITICGAESDMNGDNVILFNIDDLGNLQWQLGYGMADSSITPTSLYKLDNGKYLIAGITDATQFGNSHVFMMETDKTYDQNLCFQFLPVISQSPAHLFAASIDTFMVDTSVSVAASYSIASGVQENVICLGSPVGITEAQTASVKIFENSEGDILFDPAQLNVDYIKIYDLQGKLIRTINVANLTSTKIILTKNERIMSGVDRGIYIFNVHANNPVQPVKLSITD